MIFKCYVSYVNDFVKNRIMIEDMFSKKKSSR